MNRDQALAKIKKCLALAASSNPHEAAAAMRQAQKLMAEHQVTELDVSLADVTEAGAKAHHVDLVNWEAMLSHMVAEAFGCVVYTRLRSLPGTGYSVRRERSYMFVGVGAAAAVASYAYDVLARQCAKDRRAHIGKQSKNCKPKTKTARGDLFAQGWCQGVSVLLDKFAGNERDAALIAQYMAAQTGMSTTQPKDRVQGKNITHNDWGSGVRAGQAAKLDRGIGGTAPQGLLL